MPLHAIATILLAGDSTQTPERNPTDIRAVFSDRGRITLQLARWDDHQIVGQSPNFGQVKFLPAAFSRIDFNLDRQRVDPDLLDLTDFEGGVLLQGP